VIEKEMSFYFLSSVFHANTPEKRKFIPKKEMEEAK